MGTPLKPIDAHTAAAQCVGAGIRNQRQKAKLTQHQLGHMAGISQSVLSRMERGDHAILPKQLVALARVLAVDVESMLDVTWPRFRVIRRKRCPRVEDMAERVVDSLRYHWLRKEEVVDLLTLANRSEFVELDAAILMSLLRELLWRRSLDEADPEEEE